MSQIEKRLLRTALSIIGFAASAAAIAIILYGA